MMLTITYLIEPKEELKKKLSTFETEMTEILLSRRLWKKNQPDRSQWDSDDHLVQLKLVFLLFLKEDYDECPELECVFREGNISAELFDKFWTATAMEWEEDFEELVQNIPREQFEKLTSTGRERVDLWLNTNPSS